MPSCGDLVRVGVGRDPKTAPDLTPLTRSLLPTCIGRSTLDGKEIPDSWHSFEYVLTSVFEFDA